MPAAFGGRRVSLGDFLLVADRATVDLTNDVDRYVIAGAVRILTQYGVNCRSWGAGCLA